MTRLRVGNDLSNISVNVLATLLHYHMGFNQT